MINIGLLTYIRNIFVPPVSHWEFLIEEFEDVHLKQSALDTVLGRITASASLVDFRTKDKPLSYLLNVAPNDNENAKDFRTKLIKRIIMDGEVVVVQLNDKWYIADDFTTEGKVLYEKTYRNIFVEGIEIKKHFFSSEIYHFRYHNEKLKKLMQELNNSYAKLFRRLIDVQLRQNQLRIYTKFTGFNDPSKKEDELKKYKSYLEGLSSALKENSVVVSPRNDAYELEEKTDNYLGRSVDELQKLENIYIAKVANALQLSPLLFTGDLADVEQHEKNAVKYAIRPLFEILTTEINSKYFGKKYEYEADLIANVTPLTYNNEFEMANDIQKLVGSVLFTPDDILEMLGRERIKSEEMTKRYLTKNLSAIEGGENKHAEN